MFNKWCVLGACMKCWKASNSMSRQSPEKKNEALNPVQGLIYQHHWCDWYLISISFSFCPFSFCRLTSYIQLWLFCLASVMALSRHIQKKTWFGSLWFWELRHTPDASWPVADGSEWLYLADSNSWDRKPLPYKGSLAALIWVPVGVLQHWSHPRAHSDGSWGWAKRMAPLSTSCAVEVTS